jgi:hypothetical protein
MVVDNGARKVLPELESVFNDPLTTSTWITQDQGA